MPHVAEGHALELVAPRPRHGVDDRAGVAPVFGAEAVGLDAELLERVRIRHRVGRVAVVVVVRPAVEHVVGGVGARAARGHRLHARIGRARGEAGRRVRQHAGDERHQLRGVPAVQREVLDALLIDHRPQRAAVGVHRARRAADGHRLGDGADPETHVEADLVVDPHDDAGRLERLEAGELRRHGVAADRQPAQRVESLRVADGVGLGIGAFVTRADGGARHDARRRRRARRR